MKTLSIIIFLLSATVTVNGEPFSEDHFFGNVTAVADTVKSEEDDSTSSSILLYPDTDPYNYYAYTDRHPESFRSGFFFGNYGLGVEGVYRAELSSFYAGMFTATGGSTVLTSEQAHLSMFTGFMIGYYHAFGVSDPVYRLPGEQERFHFYVRMGPGLGLASVRRMDGYSIDSDRELGIFLGSHGGFEVSVSDRSRFYMEAGFRGFWFPGADDLGFLGGPSLSIGFVFNFSDDLNPFRY